MNGITSRCISFANGSKDCLQRVNYEFGLVLGVDEFTAEQCFFLEKEYMHNRALHGYGTVSGLLVGKEQNNGDLEIQVDTGIGIDQYGRVFIIRNKQCASLPTWLEEQEDFDGEQPIYVVARYDECETALVPIAGQPCSSSEQQMAPSRIQDSFAIGLTLQEPLHPARDAVVNLAEFLSRFRVEPDAPDRSDLGTAPRLAPIIGPAVIAGTPADFISHIDSIVETETGTPGATILTIQPALVENLLNDIFVYWLTEVRPTLDANLLDPDAAPTANGQPFPPDVLLATLSLTFSEDGSLTLDGIGIDNTVRPYLLHTQLIQELFDIPGLPGEGGEAEPQKDLLEFMTVEAVRGGPRSLNLWFHIDENLTLAADQNLTLRRVETNGTLTPITILTLSEDVGRRNGAGRYYNLRTATNLNDGDYLIFRFETDQIRVGDNGSQSLTEYIANAGHTYENYTAGQSRIHTFYIVDRPQLTIDEELIRRLIIEFMPPQQPVLPFVTVTPITLRNTILEGYELWFHLDGVAEQNEGGIEFLDESNLAMYVEAEPGSVKEIFNLQYNRIRPNLWLVVPPRETDIANVSLVRFVFGLETPMGLQAYDPASGNIEGFDTIAKYIEATSQRLEGHIMPTERFDGQALVVFAREQMAAGRIEE